MFRSDRGLADYVKDLNEARDPAHPTVISLRSRTARSRREIALQWTQTAPRSASTASATSSTRSTAAPTSRVCAPPSRAAVNAAAHESGRLERDKGESLEPKDVFEGLTAAVSVMLPTRSSRARRRAG